MTSVALQNEFCFCSGHQLFLDLNSVEVDSSDRGLHVLRPVIDLTVKINLFARPRF